MLHNCHRATPSMLVSPFQSGRHRGQEVLKALEFADKEWRRLVPNVATALTLLLGLGAIEAARFGDFELGVRFVLLAILSDGLDGVLARRWGSNSHFGASLDSLADLVAFGVAPGILYAAAHPEAPGPVRVIVMGMLAIAGAWRLARFQTEPSRRDFVGLPITVGGPLFALAVAGYQPAGEMHGIAWALVLSALMVSRVPYVRFNTGRIGRIAHAMAAVFVIALALNGGFAITAAQIVLVVYVFGGLVWGLGQEALGGRPLLGGGRRD
jgi:CDP-diacylglycerol--serine O-phosphatidyltransferase